MSNPIYTNLNFNKNNMDNGFGVSKNSVDGLNNDQMSGAPVEQEQDRRE